MASQHQFPDMNPNPVLRISGDGELAYANPASGQLLAALALEVGAQLPPELVATLRSAAAESPARSVEVQAGRCTYDVLPIAVDQAGALHLYATDVTAAKVVARFPDRNPGPVLRISNDGILQYANRGSDPIVASLGLRVGQTLPAPVWTRIRFACGNPGDGGLGATVELDADGRTWALTPVRIPEFEFINVYGADITAMKTVTKFPDQNPNPVLRFSRDGRLTYVNPAGEPVRLALGVAVGEELPLELCRQVQELAESERVETMEVEWDGRVFSLLVVPVFEFGFINVYGTDVTAAREVEVAREEIEQLLLNILPESIVGRLRSGESTIADRIDELTVLFADVVGFTEISARLPASQVIEMLNGIFSAFDQMAERHGLEKIKTIGDAYMVCGGLAPHATDHAVRVARMATEMLDFVAGFEHPGAGQIQLRIGLHVGPAVAGVIGIKKFIYDIWGDTVNTASRLESHGLPGRIQVTSETAKRLEAIYRFERRGVVDIKGKGPVETWLLAGPAGGASPG